jgi:hypothetical protein
VLVWLKPEHDIGLGSGCAGAEGAQETVGQGLKDNEELVSEAYSKVTFSVEMEMLVTLPPEVTQTTYYPLWTNFKSV